MADWDSDLEGRTPPRYGPVLVPETPSPLFDGGHRGRLSSSQSPQFASSNQRPLYFQNTCQHKDMGATHKSGDRVSSFNGMKKQRAFDKLREIRRKNKVNTSSTPSPSPKKYNGPQSFGMWPSDSDSDSELNSLASVLQKKPVTQTGAHKRANCTYIQPNGSSQTVGSRDIVTSLSHTPPHTPMLPLRKRIKIAHLREASGEFGIDKVGVMSEDSNSRSAGKTAYHKRKASSSYPDFISARNVMEGNRTDETNFNSSNSVQKNRNSPPEKSTAKGKGKQKRVKSEQIKRNPSEDVVNGQNYAYGASNLGLSLSEDSDSEIVSVTSRSESSTTHRKPAHSSQPAVRTSKFYRKTRTKASRIAPYLQSASGQQQMSRSSRSETVTVVDSDDDAAQVVQQLESDETMARKLQEELDREFALSLAETSSPQPPVPHPSRGHRQGRVRPGAGPSGYSSSDSEQGTCYFQDFPFTVHAGSWGESPLAMLTSHVALLGGGNNWASTGQGGRGGRQRRGRGRSQTRRNAVIGLNSPGINGEDYEALLNLAENIGDAKPKGLTKNQINCLPVKKFVHATGESSQNQECLVCMSEFEANEEVRILTCFHDFHAACIDKWLKKSNTCPVCREEIKLQ